MTVSTVNGKNWQNLKSAHTRIAATRGIDPPNTEDHARAIADFTSVQCKVRDLFSGH